MTAMASLWAAPLLLALGLLTCCFGYFLYSCSWLSLRGFLFSLHRGHRGSQMAGRAWRALRVNREVDLLFRAFYLEASSSLGGFSLFLPYGLSSRFVLGGPFLALPWRCSSRRWCIGRRCRFHRRHSSSLSGRWSRCQVGSLQPPFHEAPSEELVQDLCLEHSQPSADSLEEQRQAAPLGDQQEEAREAVANVATASNVMPPHPPLKPTAAAIIKEFLHV